MPEHKNSGNFGAGLLARIYGTLEHERIYPPTQKTPALAGDVRQTSRTDPLRIVADTNPPPRSTKRTWEILHFSL